MSVTGNDVGTIRVALRWSATQLAAVLMVHPTTIYRWEACQGSEVRAEGLVGMLLIRLRRYITGPDAQHFVTNLRKRMEEEGPFEALSYVFGWASGLAMARKR